MTKTLRELIRSDLDRYAQTYRLRGQKYSSAKICWESFLFKAGFQAVFLYRIGHWLYKRRWVNLAWFVSRLNVMLTGAELEFNAEIGPGLLIAHPVGIVVGRGSAIGNGATLFQGVSLGAKSWSCEEISRFPRIGNHCYLFAKAGIYGGVNLGDYCIVAAHAVVTKDMPAGSLARGVPAQIIPEEGRKAITAWLSGTTSAVSNGT